MRCVRVKFSTFWPSVSACFCRSGWRPGGSEATTSMWQIFASGRGIGEAFIFGLCRAAEGCRWWWLGP